MLRTALMVSMIESILASASSSSSSSFSLGQEDTIILSSLLADRCCHISSLIKGIKGCRSFRVLDKTYTRVYRAVDRASSFVPYNLGFTSSIYQSQYSFQIKSYTFCAAIPSSYLSRFSVTSPTSLLYLLIIHLSAKSICPAFKSLSLMFSRFIMINLVAFHILLAKFLLASTFSM